MHYVCEGGCNGVSDDPGQCQMPGCNDYQKDLKPCDCEDGNHDESLHTDTPEVSNQE